MADIKITYEQLERKTGTIRDHNDNLLIILENIRNTISNLDTQWTSDTSDTIRGKIEGMQSKFNNYHEVIESYAAFLDEARQLYETTEQSSNADALKFI